MQKQISEKEALQARLQQAVAEAKIPQQTLEDLKKGKQALEKEKAELPGHKNSAVDITKIYDLFAHIAPESVSLSKISFAAAGSPSPVSEEKGKGKKNEARNAEILLQGNVFGDDEAALQSLTDFLAQLNHSPLFTEVKLVFSGDVPAETYTRPSIKFEILLTPVAGDLLNQPRT
jgi:hypothetical protein